MASILAQYSNREKSIVVIALLVVIALTGHALIIENTDRPLKQLQRTIADLLDFDPIAAIDLC